MIESEIDRKYYLQSEKNNISDELRRPSRTVRWVGYSNAAPKRAVGHMHCRWETLCVQANSIIGPKQK